MGQAAEEVRRKRRFLRRRLISKEKGYLKPLYVESSGRPPFAGKYNKKEQRRHKRAAIRDHYEHLSRELSLNYLFYDPQLEREITEPRRATRRPYLHLLSQQAIRKPPSASKIKRLARRETAWQLKLASGPSRLGPLGRPKITAVRAS